MCAIPSGDHIGVEFVLWYFVGANLYVVWLAQSALAAASRLISRNGILPCELASLLCSLNISQRRDIAYKQHSLCPAHCSCYIS